METTDNENKKIIQAEIDKQNNRKDFYNNLSNTLDQNGDTQISTTDPDRELKKIDIKYRKNTGVYTGKNPVKIADDCTTFV